jgi:hypothetical protein
MQLSLQVNASQPRERFSRQVRFAASLEQIHIAAGARERHAAMLLTERVLPSPPPRPSTLSGHNSIECAVAHRWR